MSNEEIQMCPWCQTEIVWDAEIGPELECPHCFNDLGDYRSISLSEDEDDLDKEESVDDHDHPLNPEAIHSDYDVDYEEEADAYTLKAQELIDSQEEVPECSNCRSLMLQGGTVRLSGDNFLSVKHPSLHRQLLSETVELTLYVCPNCFKTETYLSDPGRHRLVQTLSGE
ncbi:MAG: hypothetical protein H7X86_08325 [Gorillibacterium sp.]|nr:hypothetical protein [Gorillibacterium sp.]